MRRARVAGVGSSHFDATSGTPLRVVPPPQAPFADWTAIVLLRGIDAAGASGATTRAYLDARSVVGYPESPREHALCEALQEALENLYEAHDTMSGMSSQEDWKAAVEEKEDAVKEKEDAEEERDTEIVKREGAEKDVEQLKTDVQHRDDEIDHLKDRIDGLNADLALYKNRHRKDERT